MLRPLLVIALLGSLLLAPAVQAATPEATIRTILRDCEDDGALSGSYRASELRDARRNIGTDLDQYSDCRDVLSAAEQRAAAGGSSGGTGSGGTTGAGTGAGGVPAPDPLQPGGTADPGAAGGSLAPAPLLTPASPEEEAELSELRAQPSARASVAGAPLQLGRANRLAAVVTHDIPAPLLAALVLLALGGLVAAVPALRHRLPALRRRVAARRSTA